MRAVHSVTFLLAAGVLAVAPGTAHAQPAPLPRAVVPADAAPEAMSGLFAELTTGDRTISVPGAAWLQLQFGEVDLGPNGVLTITAPSGEAQNFSQAELDAWGGLSAIFNGSELRITISPGPESAGPLAVSIDDIIVGLPAGRPGEAPEAAAPEPLRQLLGDDLRRFVPELPAPPADAAPAEGATPGASAAPEAICGTNDDRVASNDVRSGRIVPIGCTGWLIDGGLMLTAGHCVGASAQILEFNVPASLADGTTVAAAVRDQYRIIAGSVVSQNTGVGNDWALFRVQPSTETGLLPAAAQGGSFQVSNTANPAQVRITGFGVDGPPPNFGAGGPRDATNQTQQTHLGALATNTGGANSGRLDYNADTQGGNSGSPVIAEGTAQTIGIHTNGGCTTAGGNNSGTSFRNQALWAAIQNGTVRTTDILWQHINGQVHYWPILNGQRQGGINIHTPVGPDWRLIGAGDVNGDGTDDVLWQHINGQVHYWPILNGQRQGGINIHTPVGPDWRLIGAGDVNGDGTDDILWQHIFGQVHYWPILNGQRQGGINIHTPVGPDWRLIGAGDVNGDGTDDILGSTSTGRCTTGRS